MTGWVLLRIIVGCAILIAYGVVQMICIALSVMIYGAIAYTAHEQWGYDLPPPFSGNRLVNAGVICGGIALLIAILFLDGLKMPSLRRHRKQI
ncbi:MAG: hypothetical protein PHH13_03175 [Candidatus Peribacteraceae bacterium]|nr:hypothetical protein [Candidatus Peribacteraceae bacterium]